MVRGWIVVAVLLGLVACDSKPAEKKPASAPATLVTVTTTAEAPFEVLEETVGTLEALQDPKLSAEVAGRVIEIRVEPGARVARGQVLARLDSQDARLQSQADSAEVARLAALLAQQEKLVERQSQLVQKGFISPNAADDAKAQRAALAEQLTSARARLQVSQRQQGKAEVVAPIEGVVESRLVSPGDFVKVGDPLFQLVSNRALRAHLPFPESAQSRLKVGQAARLTSPLVPGKVFKGVIREIRPMVAQGSRALDVLVDVDHDGSLRAGGSVSAAVVVASTAAAITVPEHSVVLRPAGKVVYAVEGGLARARVVKVGARREGRVEILEGLKAGETIVQDGAGFLSEGAAVQVKAAKP